VPVLQIHNYRRTIVGGRTKACDILGNINGANAPGCEIVSSTTAPGATVVYTLNYPDGTTQSFTDTADNRGHSLHAFNGAYKPAPGSKHGSPQTIAYISVSATLLDGTKLGPVDTRFAVIQ
jgi:hypothetical protein